MKNELNENNQSETEKTEEFINFKVVDEELTNEEKHEILTSHESIKGFFIGSAFFLSGIYFQLLFGA
jgi:hypothetical protein